MGYRVLDIQRVNLVYLGGFLLIELQVVCEIAGGLDTDERRTDASRPSPTVSQRTASWRTRSATRAFLGLIRSSKTPS